MERFRVLTRSEHSISRKMISQPALKVLYRLRSKGYMAMLVGGAPRDLLRGVIPRDFDVVTDATIPQIRRLFRNSRTIGKRFPIVHTYFGDDLVEISSLKTDKEEASNQELILEDARRRDFTVNAIFYDIDDFEVVDPLGALDDLENGIVVGIGDHDDKFAEDPMRMLRALKLVVKHGFTLEKTTEAAIHKHLNKISEVGAGRCYEEMTRVLLSQTIIAMMDSLREYGLLERLWPAGEQLAEEKGTSWFASIRDQVKINYAQGSFAKITHMTLWFRLFVESGFYDASKDRDVVKRAFESFFSPLGMPFSPPVIDALEALAYLKQEKRMSKWGLGISNEARKLLEGYVATHMPERRVDLESLLSLNALKPKRKPRRGKGPGARYHAAGDKPKNSRRRRGGRRRRKPKNRGD